MVHRVEGEAVALGGQRSHVGPEGAGDPHDRALACEADPHLVSLVPIVPEGREILAPRLDPLHRAPETERGCRHQDFFGIDGAFRPEAATDIGDAHADPLGRKVEHPRDHVPDAIGVLGRRPYHDRARVLVAVREDAAGLDGHGGQARVAQPLVEDELGSGERALRVADGPSRDERGVVRPVRMDEVLGPDGVLDRRHRRAVART